MKLSFSAITAAALLLSAAGLSSAVPVTPEESELEPRVPLATVYSSCINPGQAAITLDDGPYIWL